MLNKSILLDPILLITLGLLIVTLYAFFMDFLFYPVGWLVLIVLAAARIHYLWRR